MPIRYARAPWWTVMVWGDLHEPDQLESVQCLGAGLVAVEVTTGGPA
jgi:hypothetical protein